MEILIFKNPTYNLCIINFDDKKILSIKNNKEDKTIKNNKEESIKKTKKLLKINSLYTLLQK